MTVSKIDAAISSVTKAVKRLEKSDRNQHGGYNFAGIDDFLAMTGRLCGEAGLSVIMDEDEFEIIPDFFQTKGGKAAGLRMRFSITLRCDGESAGPFRRSIMVPGNMGSQAFGAAQSYVLKQFLRATFQIPTGEKGDDIDAHYTGEMSAAPAKPAVAAITDEQRAVLMGMIENTGADARKFCNYFRISSVPELAASDFSAAMAMLEKKGLPRTSSPQREAA